MFKPFAFLAGSLVALGLVAAPALAQQGKGTSGYLTDTRDAIIKDPYNLCWRTGYWTPAFANCECDKDLRPKQVCEPPPPPKPAAAPPVGPIPAPLLARPRPAYPVPDHPGTRYAVATDPELPAASLTIYNKLPIREQATILSYRERIIDHLYAAMFNARLNELSQRADAPFIGAGVDRGIFVRTKEVAMLSAMTQPDRIGRALEAMLTEAARVERHGFTASELEREKRNLLRVYDQALAENDKDESAPLAAEYIRNFLTGESLPGIAWEHEMHVKFLPGISLAEVNALAREWNGDRSRVVAVSAPDRGASGAGGLGLGRGRAWAVDGRGRVPGPVPARGAALKPVDDGR